mmetsp:Transcript_17890/g.54761  ORF Transcript_17890/g.54761 Transcript_17890/m.54761 type:complete len:319 (-) Transcript_17890:144-1100(-)
MSSQVAAVTAIFLKSSRRTTSSRSRQSRSHPKISQVRARPARLGTLSTSDAMTTVGFLGWPVAVFLGPSASGSSSSSTSHGTILRCSRSDGSESSSASAALSSLSSSLAALALALSRSVLKTLSDSSMASSRCLGVATSPLRPILKRPASRRPCAVCRWSMVSSAAGLNTALWRPSIFFASGFKAVKRTSAARASSAGVASPQPSSSTRPPPPPPSSCTASAARCATAPRIPILATPKSKTLARERVCPAAQELHATMANASRCSILSSSGAVRVGARAVQRVRTTSTTQPPRSTAEAPAWGLSVGSPSKCVKCSAMR